MIRLFFVLSSLALALALVPPTEAAAPLRTSAWCTSVGLSCPSGLPYAEATLCANAAVIACEDFNGGPTYFPVQFTPPCNGAIDHPTAWYNPAQSGVGTGFVLLPGACNRQINLVSNYSALTSTSLPSNGQDYVLVSNHETSLGNDDGQGSAWLTLRDVVDHSQNGGAAGVLAAMESGHTNVKEFHIRFQIYWTWTGNGDLASYTPNGFPKSDTYANSTGFCGGHKIVFNYTPGGVFEPASAATDSGLGSSCSSSFDNHTTPGADPAGARYGNALLLFPCGGPCNYEAWPMGYGNDDNREYLEYGGYQSTSLSTRPNDSLILGKIWRWNIGQKYTFEYHIKWSNPEGAQNGIQEVWVDGTKIYTNNDVANCFGSGVQSSQSVNDDCTTIGLGALFLSDYTSFSGSLDTTPKTGQQVIDNLVVAAGDFYIGPPSGAAAPDPVYFTPNLNLRRTSYEVPR